MQPGCLMQRERESGIVPSKEEKDSHNTDKPSAKKEGSVRWDDPARYFVEDLKPKKQKHNIPPNRFGILPGPEWDGIDRSNGAERKYFQKISQEEAEKELRYLHDVDNL